MLNPFVFSRNLIDVLLDFAGVLPSRFENVLVGYEIILNFFDVAGDLVD